jgi:hypothetical protein
MQNAASNTFPVRMYLKTMFMFIIMGALQRRVLGTELFHGLLGCKDEVHEMTTRYEAPILLSHLSVYFASEGMVTDLDEKGHVMYTRRCVKN